MSDYRERLSRRFMTVLQRLRALDDSLRAVPDWLPAGDLAEMVERTRRRVVDLSAEKERKMAVVIVGPTGAGKSTLLNALAGKDGLARTGLTRPTTRTLTIFCSDPEDGRYFSEKAGVRDAEVVSTGRANSLKNLIIVDTPDTNSARADEHAPVVAAAIRAADVLLCVFPAENAVRRDQIEYLGNWVGQFNRSALYAVVTMAEKLPRGDLDREVLAPLDDLLESVWGRAPIGTFAVSARRHLENPGWGENESVHPESRDDFAELKAELSEKFNSMEAAADMRGARAEVWAAQAERMVGGQAAAAAPHAQKALSGIAGLAGEVWRAAVAEAGPGGSAARLDYSIATGLWGPVAWFFMLWTFIIHVLETLSALAGALRRAAGFVRGRSADAAGGAASPRAGVVNAVAVKAAAGWQDVRASMRRAGFSQKSQENPFSPPNDEYLVKALQAQVAARRDSLVRQLAAGTFHGFGAALFLNIVFLLPVLYLVYSAVRLFATSGTLQIGIGGDGVWFLALWWLVVLSFMHGWAALKERRLGGAAGRGILAGSPGPLSVAGGVAEELERVAALAAYADAGDEPTRPDGPAPGE